MDLDPHMYQCGTCVVDAALADLSAENYQAWQLFDRICTRFAIEQRAVGTVLDRLTADLSPDDFEDMVMRFSMLYNIYFPKPKEQKRRRA